MRIHETRRRSLLKAVSFRVIEITVDTLILNIFVPTTTALALAITFEGICFVLHFIFERIWNKIDYGRCVFNEQEKT